MTKKQKITLGRILAAGVLLIAFSLLPSEGWVRLMLFLVPYAVIGYDILWKAVCNICHGQVFDENFLMAIATVGAFATGQYPEAVFVMLFYQVGELFQGIAVGKSRRSISSLMDIRPDMARVERGEGTEEVDPEEVAVGEVVVIHPGERVPIDGTVVEGDSFLDTAALTGEPVPRHIRAGEAIVSGCINQNGILRVRCDRPFEESTVSRILELVENSAERKSRSETFITRFARYYTPAVVIGAALLAVLPPLFSGDFAGNFTTWFSRALNFLVVSCPCALVISVPLSFFGGIGGTSRMGVLFKGSTYLEGLASCDTMVFDKTGTLTKGTFRVASVHPATAGQEEKLLETAALTEQFSSHPIARSLLEAYGKAPEQSRVREVEEVAGHGLRAVVDGHPVAVGNRRLMEREGVACPDLSETADVAGTVVEVARDGKYEGYIVIADEVSPDAARALGQLRQMGVSHMVMLTGDREQAARAVAAEVGVDEVIAGCLPTDKVSHLEALLERCHQTPGAHLAYVGDGINDAPALTRADIGIAMGAFGADAAIEAADVVLMNNSLERIAGAMALSRRTRRIVRENIVFALAVKAVVLILSAIGITSLWIATFADVGVAVLAILNAMRTLRCKESEEYHP